MDPLIKSQLLYQLSYAPTLRSAKGQGPSARARNIREKASKARVTGVSDQGGGKAVDFAVIEAYAMSDRALVREVLTIYCAEAMEWARKLDSEDWRAVVHTCKGTSRSIGANRLGDLCEAAEADASKLPQVRPELNAVLREINDYLARR